MVHKVKFKQWNCILEFGQYKENDRIAISLVEEETGEDVATVTINLDKVSLSDNEVIIKDYSENEGVYEALVKAEIISRAKRYIHSGFISAPVCDLLITVPKI